VRQIGYLQGSYQDARSTKYKNLFPVHQISNFFKQLSLIFLLLEILCRIFNDCNSVWPYSTKSPNLIVVDKH